MPAQPSVLRLGRAPFVGRDREFAVLARLVRPQADGDYAFVHDKVREALYA